MTAEQRFLLLLILVGEIINLLSQPGKLVAFTLEKVKKATIIDRH